MHPETTGGGHITAGHQNAITSSASPWEVGQGWAEVGTSGLGFRCGFASSLCPGQVMLSLSLTLLLYKPGVEGLLAGLSGISANVRHHRPCCPIGAGLLRSIISVIRCREAPAWSRPMKSSQHEASNTWLPSAQLLIHTDAYRGHGPPDSSQGPPRQQPFHRAGRATGHPGQ